MTMMDVGLPVKRELRERPRLAIPRVSRPTTPDIRRIAASFRWMLVPAGLALGMRLVVFLGVAVGMRMLPREGHAGLLTSWDRWDSVWYLGIAKNGYTYSPIGASGANFFPLYPLLVHMAQLPIGPFAGARSYLLAAFAISWVTFIAACVLIYRLAADRFGRRVAHLSVLLLATFPYSFFFGAAYTESLFLLLAVAAFLAMDHRRWWLAGVCSLLAAAVRPPGLIVGVCLALAYVLDWRATRHPARRDLLALGLAPLGTLAYMAYCWQRFGDPFAYAVTSRAGWHGAHLQSGALDVLRSKLEHPGWLVHGSPASLIVGTYAVGVVIFCLLVPPIWRALGPHYAIYSLASILAPLVTYPTLGSMGRYTTVIFPAFIVVALALRRRPTLAELTLLASASLLTVFSLLFVTGRGIF